MATTSPSARPLAIRLVGFVYLMDYEPTSQSEVTYKLETLHRILPGADKMEVLVNITYQANDREEPVLTGSCLTTYELIGVPKEKDPQSDGYLYVISDELNQQMTIEAVAHARALVAQQTASTPFHESHVALSAQFTRMPDSVPVDK